jgi:energy-coupling factor transporter ATP-binding protein EcfA2
LDEAKGAWWDVGNVGLLGTRKDTLEAVTRWSLDPQGKPLYWLTGAAGSGKSTIANTLAQTLQSRLGACFFFKRGKNLLNTYELLASTLARQLSRYNEDLAREILGPRNRGSSHVTTILGKRPYWATLLSQLRIQAILDGFGPFLLCSSL